MIRSIVFTTLLVLVSGCLTTMTVSPYYIPTDLRYLDGPVDDPFKLYWCAVRVPLGETSSMRIDVKAVANGISVQVQLTLPPGMKVRFTKPEVSVLLPGTSLMSSTALQTFSVPTYRPKQSTFIEYIDAGAVLEGRGRNAHLTDAGGPYMKNDHFRTIATLNVDPVPSLTLHVPSIEVDGKAFTAHNIPLKLVSKIERNKCAE